MNGAAAARKRQICAISSLSQHCISALRERGKKRRERDGRNPDVSVLAVASQKFVSFLLTVRFLLPSYLNRSSLPFFIALQKKGKKRVTTTAAAAGKQPTASGRSIVCWR